MRDRLARLSPEQRALLEARLSAVRSGPEPATVPLAGWQPDAAPALSFSQERLWFLEQLEGPSATFNIAFAIRLHGSLHLPALRSALDEIVRRHESLRTSFPAASAGEPPSVRIASMTEYWLPLIDLETVPGTERESAERRCIDEFVIRPMSMGRETLFYVQLVRIAPGAHTLLLLMHHAIADGWSFEVFFREVSVLYADRLAGRPLALPALSAQYSDFARWQRRQLEGPGVEVHLRHWRKRLTGAPPFLQMPTDFPYPAAQSYRGAYLERQTEPGLRANLRRLERETGATTFMTMLAVFGAFLHRHTGQADVVVGSPVSHRDRVEWEPVIGFFVNMVPFRISLADDPLFGDLIEQVRRSVLEDLQHQEMSFERLVRELQPERNLGRSPVFQAALMMLKDGSDELQLQGIRSEFLPIATNTSKYDLSLFAIERGDELVLGLEYATDLFSEATAERLLARLQRFLGSIVANSRQRVSELDLLPAAEAGLVLQTWNRTEAEFPKDKTIHALFEDQVSRTPDTVAVESDGVRLSYRELDHRAERLAAGLRGCGVGIGDCVGLFVERSVDMVAALLGVLKAGAAYVPLDPAFPRDRLAFMASDAGIRVFVTHEHLRSRVPDPKGQILGVEIGVTGSVKASGPGRREGLTADDLAYVIYTSGSTGRPKGVEISHRAVVNFLESMRRRPGLEPHDVLLAITTFSFDIAGLELLLPLVVGARVIIASRDVMVDGERLAQLLDEAEITIMQGTPATWRLLLTAGWSGRRELKVLCGGEALPPELAAELIPRCRELWNMYGPTETTIWSTCTPVVAGDSIDIGRPIANTELYVLQSGMQPAPIGVTGELFIGGIGLARGYRNRVGLTEERFVPNPFKPGERLYRTGDRAAYRADGRVVCLGRVDSQVKIRGFRVELGEIEAAMERHPGVAQAAVTVESARPGGPSLVGYWVAREGGRPTPGDLRAHLRSTLPDYMVPSNFVCLDRLPLTPNGKVDRKRLVLPSLDARVARDVAVAPRTATEAGLAEVWARVLGRDTVGVTDNFFDLGGHSLLAMKLFVEIERRLGCKLPLATLFRSATVEALARDVDAARPATAAWSSLVPIRATGTKPVLYCVHGAGGNVLLYRDLSQCLGPDYPVFGFQSIGLDGRSPPLETVEAMAARYVSELRAWQPRGPYHLAGYCLGGMVAYQMARLLRGLGENVQLVALLDAYNPALAGRVSRLGLVWQRTKFHLGNLAALRLRESGRYLREKFRVAMDGELANLVGTVGDADRVEGDVDNSRVQQSNDRAAGQFKPQTYAGAVTVFKPKVNYDFMSDPQLGWGGLVEGGLTVVQLPVNPHAMLIEPFVEHLAEELRHRLVTSLPGAGSDV